jgi:hypothetical protein
MGIADIVPPQRLRELIDYDPQSGTLRWKPRKMQDFNCCETSRARVCNAWNRKYAGQEITSAMSDGRRTVHINLGVRQRTQAARVAWAIYHGEWPSGVIDHIDGDCTNDRIHNLREATQSQNNRNQRIGLRNTSGKVGVTFYKRTAKWRAWVSDNGKVVSLGYFDNFDDAVAARRSAENCAGFYEATRMSERKFA